MKQVPKLVGNPETISPSAKEHLILVSHASSLQHRRPAAVGHRTGLAGVPLDGAKGELAAKARQAVQGRKFSPVGET